MRVFSAHFPPRPHNTAWTCFYRSQSIFPAVHASVGAGMSCRGIQTVGVFASAWLPVCMSAHLHGFGVHLGVCCQYWGGKRTQWGLAVCAFKKWWDPEAVISVLAWMTSWAIHRRGPGVAMTLHSSAAYVGQLCASLLPLEPCRLCLATPFYHGVIKGRRGRAKF